MRQKTLRGLACSSVFLLTLVGSLMRYYQLHTIFDESGLPEVGSPASWLLAFFSVLVVLFCALSSFGLRSCKKEASLFVPNGFALATGMISGICLAVGSLLSLMKGLNAGFGAQFVLEVLQLLAGFCVLVATWQRRKNSGSHAVLHAIICIWLVLTLLLNFKNWSTDPTILDYCFRLFALIFGMCAAYHVGSFCLEKGNRKITTFWCLAGIYFSVVSAIGEGMSWKLMAVGVCFWQLSNTWMLMDEIKA